MEMSRRWTCHMNSGDGRCRGFPGDGLATKIQEMDGAMTFQEMDMAGDGHKRVVPPVP